jgi:thiosulfate dehydrogenase [quinone] large subunit
MTSTSKIKTSSVLPWALTIVRMVIGWHFLYEGISKIIIAGWSSAPYLAGSKWIFAPLFTAMANSPSAIAVIDFINIWGMILVGLGLILGLFTRWAAAGGTLMLFFYFIAYPPIPGYMFGVPVEGSYLWVNRNLIELFALAVFIFISLEHHYSLDRLIARWREEKARKPVGEMPADSKTGLGRREALRNLISIPALGAFAYALYRKKK